VGKEKGDNSLRPRKKKGLIRLDVIFSQMKLLIDAGERRACNDRTAPQGGAPKRERGEGSRLLRGNGSRLYHLLKWKRREPPANSFLCLFRRRKRRERRSMGGERTCLQPFLLFEKREGITFS